MRAASCRTPQQVADVRDDARMPISEPQFVASVVAAVPEAQQVVEKHLVDQEGELLLHLLMADLMRLAIASFEQGDADLLRRLLAVIDAGLRDGDEEVENAVAVSFVENTGWWDPQMQPFIATWPAGLRAEADEQRNWRPQSWQDAALEEVNRPAVARSKPVFVVPPWLPLVVVRRHSPRSAEVLIGL
jgi:hypothetical protein